MPRCCTIALLLLLTLAGCRQANPDVEMLESELRWLEDQVYLLDQQLQVKSAELESARRSNTSLKNLLATQQSGSDGRRRGSGLGSGLGGAFGGSDWGQSSTAAPPGAGETPDDLRPPGARSAPDDTAPRTPPRRSPGSDRPPITEEPEEENDDLKPPSVDLGEGAGADPVNTPEPTDGSAYRPAATANGPMLLAAAQRPASRSGLRLALNPRVTGGCDLDDCPGDDGLMVLLQTFDSNDQPLKVLGPVTLELRDPSRRDEPIPLGHWDIDASVVATKYGKTLFGEGVHLQLPWSGSPPPSGTWLLTATLLTEDGEWLGDQRKITIEVAGDPGSPGSTTAQREQLQPWGPHRPPTLYGAGGVPEEPSLLPAPTDEQSGDEGPAAKTARGDHTAVPETLAADLQLAAPDAGPTVTLARRQLRGLRR
ncbi:MAG: hypothetical protein U0795_16455 [Pirellulales bacterium]